MTPRPRLSRFTSLEECAPAPILLLLSFIEPILRRIIGPDWRLSLPFGLGVDGGLLSHELPPDSLQWYFPTLLTFGDFWSMSSDGGDGGNNDGNNGSSLSFFSKMYKFAFQTANTSLGDLTSTDSILTLLVIVLLLRTFKKYTHPIFCSIGTQLAIQTHGLQWTTLEVNREKITKFGEYVFRLLYHSSVSFYGVYYFWDKPWWDWSVANGNGNGNGNAGAATATERETGTALLFRGYPNHDIDVGMAWYYLLQCAYNIDALVSLLELSFDISFPFLQSRKGNDETNKHPDGSMGKDKDKDSDKGKDKNKNSEKDSHTGDNNNNNNNNNNPQSILLSTNLLQITWSNTVRGDFPEMMVHHIITNCLIFGSSHFRLTRIGSIIFLLHDISDVPIDMSKLANFVKWTKTTIGCFVSMVIVWVITRMTVLPFVIVRSVWYESHLVFMEGGMMDARFYRMYFAPFFALLCGITALHYFWFGIFIKIAKDLTKGKVQDYSEHKKGEPEAELEGTIKSKED